ncbi:MAG: response regulator transcription factor [Desulfobacteraceae bacterium]|nr:response regulator transcription factor [Desulfobacteraceae bacterium]
MSFNRILVAEDDPDIRLGLVDTLESEGYLVFEAQNGLEAVKLFKLHDIDLLLLDVMMPEKNGYDVLREIRADNNQVSVIMLTAKGEEIDKVLGLELGADDYITKPFGIHELLARISAVLRRSSRTIKNESGKKEDSQKFFGGHSIDFKRYKFVKNNAEFDLSEREIQLIKVFHDHPDEVLSRDFLLDKVWGIDYPGTTRTLDQHIAQLRKKIEEFPADPKVITTVHGIGYRYKP